MAMMIRRLPHAVLVLTLAPSIFAEPAFREARVDAHGVMRSVDNAEEVTRFGVNYYPPFSVDYRRLTERGLDLEAVMQDDVAHFRRLGLDCIRLHCYDRQFSTREGAFVANDHVAKLDYLIALCASNGIQTVLTPIAWWGKAFAPGSTEGFSNFYTMEQMTSDRRAWKTQARFLTEFARHVNPYTGRSYGMDPAILAFELINEPHYPSAYADDDLVDYINTLADALRAGGTSKPIFYNSWNGRHAAAIRARIDGETNSDYPLGLRARHERFDKLLGLIKPRQFDAPLAEATHARMIYEFDTADTSAACLYPALARSFRHQGVQVANQFQYDTLPLAAQNANWDTHYLNLVYTPAKALSFAIAAKVFHRLPRGCEFVSSHDRMPFTPFCVDEARNLSEFVTAEDYWYTAPPLTPAPDPARLCRVYGVGRSAVVSCTGAGIYFLDKVSTGLWRLQLYPDVFQVNDPYDGHVEDKVLALDAEVAFGVRLPGLGRNWLVRQAGNGAFVCRAKEDRVRIRPGDYVLVGYEAYDEFERRAVADCPVPRFVIPPLSAAAPLVRLKRIPKRWGAQTPLKIEVESRNVEILILTATPISGGSSLAWRNTPSAGDFSVSLPAGDWSICVQAEGRLGKVLSKAEQIRVYGNESEWQLFNVSDALKTDVADNPRVRIRAGRDEMEKTAVGVEVVAASDANCGYAGYKVPFDCESRSRHFPMKSAPRFLLVHARAAKDGERVEIVFTQSDGRAWGTVMTLSKEWKEHRLAIADFRPHWGTGVGTAEDCARPETFVKVNLGFGDWLFGVERAQYHMFEVSDISFEKAVRHP